MVVTVRSVLQGAIGIVVGVFWLTATAAKDSDYHLTGIIGSNTGEAYAVIEQADGQQHLLTEGGTIGNGYVGSISAPDKTVVLVFPQGELLLSLTGSGKPIEYEESKEEFSTADFNKDGDVVSQTFLDQASIKELRALASASGTMSDTEQSTQLNKLLGLEEQARIRGFNQLGVDSTRDLLKELGARLASPQAQGGYLGTISVSDKGGNRRVYLQIPPAGTQ